MENVYDDDEISNEYKISIKNFNLVAYLNKCWQ